MKKTILTLAAIVTLAAASTGYSGWFSSGPQTLTPKNDRLDIPLKDVNDGKAHHYQVKAVDGTTVIFFVLKSGDGIVRAAIDSCDVCYKSGKGYYQDGDFMICVNCGQRFASNKINEVKGGCNPAPLEREVAGDKLTIAMNDINKNSWYMHYRK